MHDFIELLRVVVWPVTTLAIVLVLRAELQRFARNIADRIESATSVTIGPKGIELKGIAKVVPLSDQLQQRKVKLSRYIRGLESPERLGNLARTLGVPESTDLRTQKNEIILEINRRVETREDMDRLSALLRDATRQDF